MRLKAQIFLFVTLSLFCLSLYTTTPTVAFVPDSYQNKVGEEYIWDVKVSGTGYFLYGNVNATDQLKMVITTINQTLIYSYYWDCVWARFYRKTATDSDWVPWTTTEKLVGAYHESIGILPVNLILFVVPHNETAIIGFLHLLSTVVSGSYDWMSGDFGYDGYGSYWSSDITNPGAMKVEMHFSENSTINILKVYNSTGSKWILLFHMEIYIPPIPAFSILSVSFILLVCLVVYVLQLKRKPEIMF